MLGTASGLKETKSPPQNAQRLWKEAEGKQTCCDRGLQSEGLKEGGEASSLYIPANIQAPLVVEDVETP